jgi:hypothetical protein
MLLILLLDVFRSRVVCGDFIEDMKAGIQVFAIGFICLDKEVIDYEAKTVDLSLLTNR